MTYNDPTRVHGGECPRCLNWKFDNEEDFAPSGDCWECAEADPDDIDPVEGLTFEDRSPVTAMFKKAFG